MGENESSLNSNIVKINEENQMGIFSGIKLSAIPIPDIVPQLVKDMESQRDDFIKNISTHEERIKPITERVDKLQKELEHQTSELQKLRYENIKLNSKIEILNKTNDNQLSEITDLKANEITLKNTIVTLKQEIENITRGNKWSILKGVFIGVGGTVIGGLLLNYITTII